MPDHLALRLASVRQLNVEQINADDLPSVLALRAERLFSKVVHSTLFGKIVEIFDNRTDDLHVVFKKILISY